MLFYSVDMTTLREQLYEDGEYFKHVLSLIPGNYCVDTVDHSAVERDTGRAISSKFLSFCKSRIYYIICLFLFIVTFISSTLCDCMFHSQYKTRQSLVAHFNLVHNSRQAKFG